MTRNAHLRIVSTARDLAATLRRSQNSGHTLSEASADLRTELGPENRYDRTQKAPPTFHPPRFVDEWKREQAAAAFELVRQPSNFLRGLTISSIVATALTFAVLMLWVTVGALRGSIPSTRTEETTTPNFVRKNGPTGLDASTPLRTSVEIRSPSHLPSATLSSQAPLRPGAKPTAQVLVPFALSLPAGGVRPLAISVEPNDPGSTALILVSGLPRGTRLSAGRSLTNDLWSIDVSNLTGLTMTVPTTSSGHHDVVFKLVSHGNNQIAMGRTQLTIEVQPQSGSTKRLLELGKRQFQEGQVAIARLYFLRAADDGDGEAARLLGDTYVPAKLSAIGAIGVKGDISVAVSWYRRADELGDPHAKARLAAIQR